MAMIRGVEQRSLRPRRQWKGEGSAEKGVPASLSRRKTTIEAAFSGLPSSWSPEPQPHQAYTLHRPFGQEPRLRSSPASRVGA